MEREHFVGVADQVGELVLPATASGRVRGRPTGPRTSTSPLGDSSSPSTALTDSRKLELLDALLEQAP
jgi:hypothetical protein